jgi:hypothetical protein
MFFIAIGMLILWLFNKKYDTDEVYDSIGM